MTTSQTELYRQHLAETRGCLRRFTDIVNTRREALAKAEQYRAADIDVTVHELAVHNGHRVVIRLAGPYYGTYIDYIGIPALRETGVQYDSFDGRIT